MSSWLMSALFSPQLLQLMPAQEGSIRGQGCFPLRTTGGDVLQIRGAGCARVFWLLQTEIELQYTRRLDLGSLTALPLPPCLRSDDCQTDLSVRSECSSEEGFLRGRAAGLTSPAEPIILQQLFIVNCSPYLQPERRAFFSACGFGFAVSRVRLNPVLPLRLVTSVGIWDGGSLLTRRVRWRVARRANSSPQRWYIHIQV